ncbi:MAG TPA: RNA 2'-phosphotransferase [Chloroflexi bacterium]|nr:RNA 2'-phosphotransferase [Chloroflexota bacterium]
MKPDTRLIKLSKFLSLILRHQPERFALEIDTEGWASLPEVMEILHGLPNFRWATRADVMAIVEGTIGDGQRRFEVDVDDQRIRARYGHSLSHPIRYAPCTPPPLLYHGTSPAALAHIQREGLKPMRRQYVHLSATPAAAARVGARHTASGEPPVILRIQAAKAHAAGVQFFQAGDDVYLTTYIPPQFVELERD